MPPRAKSTKSEDPRQTVLEVPSDGDRAYIVAVWTNAAGDPYNNFDVLAGPPGDYPTLDDDKLSSLASNVTMDAALRVVADAVEEDLKDWPTTPPPVAARTVKKKAPAKKAPAAKKSAPRKAGASKKAAPARKATAGPGGAKKAPARKAPARKK